ncbi:MAG TPA: hypothetical protein VEC01_16855 [Noviherbaspirillum sp.]|uniref:hypothetical protein n=1 Tax=Noviherbaspirillum sp. TaxID=1926288 RepID=UPI002D6E8D55|nr:hypothetical protein [Noviherbaspirillum sp.]HYD97001.1 hypothetical protein [Noviherbaspirillum sp.]
MHHHPAANTALDKPVPNPHLYPDATPAAADARSARIARAAARQVGMPLACLAVEGPGTPAALRRLPRDAQLPLIFMTAKVQAAEIAHYHTPGAISTIRERKGQGHA